MATRAEGPGSDHLKRVVVVLRILVIGRFLLHALYLPVYEGPDEPFHLARAAALVDGAVSGAFTEREVSGAIVASINAYPCCPDLERAFACLPFGGEPAAFNLLRVPMSESVAPPVANYQAHQPPLYYFVAGGLLKLAAVVPRDGGLRHPARQILLLRLFAVLLVTVALLGPLRKVAQEHGLGWQLAILLLLLVPGAAESLVRVSNDVGVFLWCALVVLLVRRSARTLPLILLLACGPLIKLTALPVVAFAAVALWQHRGPRAGLSALVASSVVFVVQALRGWSWGGTLELNASEPLRDSLGAVLAGVAHSSYTFVKTSLWLGGWSVFRPPAWLLASGALLLLGWLLCLRFKGTWSASVPHLAACLVAVAGFVAFAIGKRQLFGVWGAVGGWYAWGWLPWLAVAVEELFTVAPRRGRFLLVASVVWVFVAEICWFLLANSLYVLP